MGENGSGNRSGDRRLAVSPGLDRTPDARPRRRPQINAAMVARTANSVGGSEEIFDIGELASHFGITTRTIRFYEEKGIVSPARQGNARLFNRRDRARLTLALRGKRLGFSLEEIREYLDLYDVDRTHQVQLEHLQRKVEEMLKQLREKQADLELSISELEEVRDICERGIAGVDDAS